MSKNGPIIYVEDDEDDFVLFQLAIQELKIQNTVHHFYDGEKVMEYLLTTGDDPFLILCDVNLPRISGLELRDKIEASPFLKQKSIPFVFFSTASNASLVNKAFANAVQGFFQKPHSYHDMRDELSKIYKYWQACEVP
ncbi:response regulator [Dyadobacter sandarakinus]|uniref:Response regulator n=1 Tax=Dyadobacter sandarakinus TaxID=2747268 RepID=A0ABX7IAW1_9BACT|nr:response regulator [Dyadobacter sandarakinus]QRR03257.1 response regulator [Dyadobacter sandarakinus]